MSAPERSVSVVMPCLEDRDLLERHLPLVLAELERRGGRDEVVLVDDTGLDVLDSWVRATFGEAIEAGRLRVLARLANGGFSQALLDGVLAARREFVFAMNPDIRVHPGFLEPLIAALEDPEVHSAVPRILLFGRPHEVESLVEIGHVQDIARVRQPGLEAGRDAAAREWIEQPSPVPYGVGGALLMRRAEFIAADGFESLYEPFYFEDVDLGFAAWRAGRQVRYVPEAVVEHHHRGSIGKRIDPDLVRAVIERNRYLFQWRFLDDPERIRRHMAALYRTAVDAYLCDEREPLIWLAMALERLEQLESSRARLGPAVRGYEDVCRDSRPRRTT